MHRHGLRLVVAVQRSFVRACSWFPPCVLNRAARAVGQHKARTSSSMPTNDVAWGQLSLQEGFRIYRTILWAKQSTRRFKYSFAATRQ